MEAKGYREVTNQPKASEPTEAKSDSNIRSGAANHSGALSLTLCVRTMSSVQPEHSGACMVAPVLDIQAGSPSLFALTLLDELKS